MSAPPMMHHASLDFVPPSYDSSEEDVRAQVCELLSTLYPKHEATERRVDSRYPFPHLVHLWPVGADGVSPQGTPAVVAGKHLSERGLSFYHPEPIPHRRMIASMHTPDGRSFAFLIDLSWCRFTGQGWYESGGRLLQPVLPPVEALP